LIRIELTCASFFLSLICKQISDESVLRLIRSFLEARVMVDGTWEPTRTGVSQGGVASSLWSNIYLTPFHHAMTDAGYRLARFADDFVVICNTRQEAEAAMGVGEDILAGEARRQPASGRRMSASSFIS
jgi:retron-type reverse transcriptase